MRTSHIGIRVSYWRRRRNLTRQEFADLCERSLSWVDKVEAGERSLHRLPMLERIARVLDVSVAVLADSTASSRAAQCIDAAEVRAIRSALGRYDNLLMPGASNEATPDLDRLRRDVDYLGHAWLSSHFSTLGKTLPRAIRAAQTAVQVLDADARQEARRLLVMSYKIASSTLLKFDDADIGWLAADRAMAVAVETDDPLCLLQATRAVARAMAKAGQPAEALRMLATAADRNAPAPGSSPSLRSAYGMVLLAAESAAADAGDSDAARAMHDRAASVAAGLGADHQDARTAFGPANVAIHRVAAALRVDKPATAVALARALPSGMLDSLPRERTACFRLDAAEAYARCGRVDDAGESLLAAEATAAEEVRCRPAARTLLTGLIEAHHGAPPSRLRGLATRIGVPA